jgi:hypothetical protein
MSREDMEVLTALRDELAAVSPSPDFADRVRQQIAGDLPLLREELAAVEPSPSFKARVRQQIEVDAQARMGSRWFDWRWLVPAGAVAAALIAAVVMAARPGAETPAPEIRTVKVEPQSPQTPPEPRTVPRAAASPLRASKVDVPLAKGEPSLEVITNQPAILRSIVDRALRNAPVIEGTIPMSETAPEIKVLPIEVNPVVVKLLVEPPESGVSPIIRKN